MDNKTRAQRVEQLSVNARLQDLALYMRDGQAIRLQKIYTVMQELEPGAYLIGAGPYTQGAYSAMCDEVVIGRLATVVEKASAVPVDILVNDNVTLTPREVSRVHCSIYRKEGVTRHDYWIVDRGSTCGTFLNGERLEPPVSSEEAEIIRASHELSDGDIISLGPSMINTFMFVDLRPRSS
jgi:hypothetical protein